MKTKLLRSIAIAVNVILALFVSNAHGQNYQASQWIDYVQTSHNPIVNRISSEEIQANVTPAAVAYNFINAILKKNFNKMLSYCSAEGKSYFRDKLNNEYNSSIQSFFKNCFSEGKLGILSWQPALSNGYEIAVAFIQDESHFYKNDGWYAASDYTLKNGKIYLHGDTYPQTTQVTKKIYITCSPSSQVNHVGFQDIVRYGNTNVKVLVTYNNGKWEVDGFK